MTRRRGSIAIVTRGDIFPAHHGRAVKIHKCAAAESRYTDVYIVTDDAERYFRYRRGVFDTLRYPAFVRELTAAAHVGDGVPQGLPPADTAVYKALNDRRFDVRLDYVASWHDVAVFQAEVAVFARPCLEVAARRGARTLLVEHNVDFDRLVQQNPRLTASARAWLRRTEVGLCRRVDAVVVVSKSDRRLLIDAGVPARRITVIPHGVDLAAYRRRRDPRLRARLGVPQDSSLLVFHGTLQYAPNLDALQILVTEILPRLRAQGRKIKLLVIGGDSAARPIDGDVVYIGPVDDLAPYLRVADAAVVPIRSGGGTRMKILEYFAASVPVIATAKAVEGLALKHRRDAWITDDWDEMAGAAARLLDRPADARALARRARLRVRELDWREIGRRYVRLARLI
jgi:glycosyltransferase involved in cell wall biosynthesis